jgi:hypothetical protein
MLLRAVLVAVVLSALVSCQEDEVIFGGGDAGTDSAGEGGGARDR